jgi:hypothetical protein
MIRLVRMMRIHANMRVTASTTMTSMMIIPMRILRTILSKVSPRVMIISLISILISEILLRSIPRISIDTSITRFIWITIRSLYRIIVLSKPRIVSITLISIIVLPIVIFGKWPPICSQFLFEIRFRTFGWISVTTSFCGQSTILLDILAINIIVWSIKSNTLRDY